MKQLISKFKELSLVKKVLVIGSLIIVAFIFSPNDNDRPRSTSSTSTYDSYYDAKCRQCKMDYNKKDEGHVIDGGQIYKASDYGFTSAPFCSWNCAMLYKSQRGY